jgi:hypothetical protein
VILINVFLCKRLVVLSIFVGEMVTVVLACRCYAYYTLPWVRRFEVVASWDELDKHAERTEMGYYLVYCSCSLDAVL